MERTKQIQSDSKTLQGHGMVVFRLFDTKSGKGSVLVAKVQGEEKTLEFNEENEEDICKQFKVAHGSKEFFKTVLDRTTLKLESGVGLRLDFDWSGITRLQVVAAERAAKIAERKRQEEEAKLAREKALEEERLAKERAKAEEERRKKEEERRRADAEELKRRQEEERVKREAEAKRKAFEDKIMLGMLDPSAVMSKIKHKSPEEEEEERELEACGITKTWSEEHQAFYYYSTETNELSWRDPRIKSPWEKKWDADQKAFYYVNNATGDKQWKEPWSNEFFKVWDNERRAWNYVSMVSGETQTREPEF